MTNKATKNKVLKIVLPDVEKRVYDRIKKLAVEEKRTIGKQTEYLAALAIDKLYKW
jgi:hypothetical protein